MGWLQEQIFKETGKCWWNLVEKAKRIEVIRKKEQGCRVMEGHSKRLAKEKAHCLSSNNSIDNSSNLLRASPLRKSIA